MRAVLCPVCQRSGLYQGKRCHRCNGRGWVCVHNAASDLLAACELAIKALSGFWDEAVALEALRAAVALAKGEN